MTTRSTRSSVAAFSALVAVGTLVLSGCAGVRSERQGVQVGRAICDLKGADSKEAAQREIDKITEDLNDARRITGVDVGQDVRAIDENLEDMAEHVAQGNDELLQQDVAVIRRNLSQAIRSSSDNARRYYEGVREGVDDCYDP